MPNPARIMPERHNPRGDELLTAEPFDGHAARCRIGQEFLLNQGEAVAVANGHQRVHVAPRMWESSSTLAPLALAFRSRSSRSTL